MPYHSRKQIIHTFQTQQGFLRQNLFSFVSGFYLGLELTYPDFRSFE